MKCGDLGHATVTGRPCGQNIPAGASGCLWHSRTPGERSLLASQAGSMNRKSRALGQGTPVQQFTNRQDVIDFANAMAKLALKGQLDLRRIDTALRAAGVALTAFAQEVNEKLVDALLQIEHGSAAILMLSRLQEGLNGQRRPLPPRAVTTLPAQEQPA